MDGLKALYRFSLGYSIQKETAANTKWHGFNVLYAQCARTDDFYCNLYDAMKFIC